MQTAVFLVQCPDQKGLVSRISTFFYERDFNILHCQQHTDVPANRYYMRVVIDLKDLKTSRQQLEEEFAAFAAPLGLEWSAHYSEPRQRVALLVTRASHCLYDLLVRQSEGELPCEIPVVIGNHPDLELVAGQFRVPFHALPVTPATRAAQDTPDDLARIGRDIERVVLARAVKAHLEHRVIVAGRRTIVFS